MKNSAEDLWDKWLAGSFAPLAQDLQDSLRKEFLDDYESTLTLPPSCGEEESNLKSQKNPTTRRIVLRLPMKANTPTMNGRIYSEECVKDLAEQLEGKLVYLQSDPFDSAEIRNCAGKIVSSSPQRVIVELFSESPSAKKVFDLLDAGESIRLNPVSKAPHSGGRLFKKVEILSVGILPSSRDRS
ncbi:MAG: hypothetical protein MJA83_16730 [Gammaproteobacteria bacterium]|nr:hypothetical protein [Gammaproteobacteria bacterium]